MCIRLYCFKYPCMHSNLNVRVFRIGTRMYVCFYAYACMCAFMYICVKHAPCIGVCACWLWSLCLWSYLYTCVWLCLCVGGFLACNFVRLMCLGMHMCVCAYINAAHEETCTNVCTYACTYICSLERSHTWLTLLPNHPR